MQNNAPLTLLEKLKKNPIWFLIIGILLIITGLLAFSNLVVATIITMYMLGSFLMASGIIFFIQSFYLKQTSLFTLTIIWSVIYTIAGGYIILLPIVASELFTILLGCLLVFFGISRLFSWFMVRKLAGSSWLALTAFINILLGTFIISAWPVNSLILFGFFLGVDLLIQGFCFVMLYSSIKQSL